MSHHDLIAQMMEEEGGGDYSYPITGLVAEYKFRGGTTDTSGNGFDLTNANILPTADRYGVAAGAYNWIFGDSDYMTVASSGALNTFGSGDFSMIFWAWRSVDDDTSSAHIMSKRINSAPFKGVIFGMLTGQTLGVILDFGVTQATLGGVTIFPKGEWVFGAVTRVGTNITLYCNGVYEANSDVAGNDADASIAVPLHVGADRRGGGLWAGPVDDFVMYNRGLPSAEILAIYNASKP